MIVNHQMTRDEDTYPVETIVRINKTGQFARIKQVCFLKNERNFLHYLAEIEGREGLYAVYHEDIELESLSPEK